MIETFTQTTHTAKKIKMQTDNCSKNDTLIYHHSIEWIFIYLLYNLMWVLNNSELAVESLMATVNNLVAAVDSLMEAVDSLVEAVDSLVEAVDSLVEAVDSLMEVVNNLVGYYASLPCTNQQVIQNKNYNVITTYQQHRGTHAEYS